jgi:hypothetical protein
MSMDSDTDIPHYYFRARNAANLSIQKPSRETLMTDS